MVLIISAPLVSLSSPLFANAPKLPMFMFYSDSQVFEEFKTEQITSTDSK
ncbi:hypothetical Protein YC6258_03602 [Gynuella sunshinyii YC6258]|uniref:Uncharacterized protein n=1 Tax=Gynuella sunshinyii YC6258 TaxID=1445510 RepID=A0A0C5VQD4_9GAMM|nr:hypothetical Protein YC6258_03602 [Gynuella sunshinyii YC6258]